MTTSRADQALAYLGSEIRRLEAENAELREELRRDQMTGLYNARALKEFVAGSPWPGWYVFADGDGIGKLNKTVGHDRVNEYILEFGTWLRSVTRHVREGYKGEERRAQPLASDAWAIRRHGDEFLVWCSSKMGALRIRNAIRRWRSKDGIVSWSAGMGKDTQTADANCTEFKKRRKDLAA